MALPDYELSLNNATTAQDIAEFVVTHNINAEELVQYINAIRTTVAESLSTETQGVTAAQVRQIIQSERSEILLPVVWSQLTLPIDSANPELGTMTRTENTDGSVSVVITNVKNSRLVNASVRTFAGNNTYQDISVSTSFITVVFDRIEDLSPTAGHSDNNTDPNIKRVIII